MVNIRLNLTLVDFTKNKDIKLNIQQQIPLMDILNQLGIPENQVGFVIKNGKWAPKNCIVYDDDTIELFPQLSGG